LPPEHRPRARIEQAYSENRSQFSHSRVLVHLNPIAGSSRIKGTPDNWRNIAITLIDRRGRQPTAPAAAPTDRATPLPPPCADRLRSGHPPSRIAAAKSAAATGKNPTLSLQRREARC
jgi:hypothetical protein